MIALGTDAALLIRSIRESLGVLQGSSPVSLWF